MVHLQLLLFLALASFHPSIVAAAAIEPSGTPNKNGINPEKALLGLGNEIISILTLVAGITAILYLIRYGIMYITAGGDGTRTKVARSGILNAITGIVVIVAAYAIIRFAISLGNAV